MGVNKMLGNFTHYQHTLHNLLNLFESSGKSNSSTASCVMMPGTEVVLHSTMQQSDLQQLRLSAPFVRSLSVLHVETANRRSWHQCRLIGLSLFYGRKSPRFFDLAYQSHRDNGPLIDPPSPPTTLSFTSLLTPPPLAGSSSRHSSFERSLPLCHRDDS